MQIMNTLISIVALVSVVIAALAVCYLISKWQKRSRVKLGYTRRELRRWRIEVGVIIAVCVGVVIVNLHWLFSQWAS